MTYGIEPPEYRLPAGTQVGAVSLQVSDLEASTDFYGRILGFEVVDRSSERVALGVGSRPLVYLRAGAAGRLRQRRLGLYHFAILLPDRASLGRCVAHLLDSGLRPGASDHLVSEAIYLQDPDGLGIEIYRDRPRDAWTVHGQQLAMASEPLDLNAVVESGEAQRWHGMPAGTVIGHMHLSVGDLELGKAFYHAGVGLDLIVWSYPGALFLSAGGYHHHLGINTWAGPSAHPAADQEPRLLEWELALPEGGSVVAAAENLVSQGYLVTTERFGDVWTSDPWGTKLRLTTIV